ncbi:MFS transporter [uncultured Methylobacterium sp.]|jgi:PPP family 3-phenylpropionic acid transporter|uniref:MFS transporter n=1 Tax=uncultured Methylobacterium sp. TaxID=157278 RepID=UPI0026100C1D|nr:MFS transporter [uncultured Methylobacterium sp.]
MPPRFLLAFVGLYGGYGMVSPFLPAFLAERGLDPRAIGLVLAAGTGVRLLAGPCAGRLADRRGAGRAVLVVCGLLTAGATLAFLAGHGFPALLAVGILYAAASAPLAPLADALALPAAAAGRFAYGHLRGAGSAAFIAASLTAGLVAGSFGTAAVLALGALGFAGLSAAAAGLPVPPAAPEREGGGLGRLLRSGGFLRLVLAAALVVGSHAVHDAFAVIRWREAGVSPAWIGLLWAEAVAAEVAVFLVLGPPLLDRLGPGRALALAAAAGILRWSVMALTAALPAVAAAQALHGATFALLHLACLRRIGDTVPSRLAATALTLYGSVGLGLSTAGLTLAAGALYAGLGPGAFWVMAALCVPAIPLALSLRQDPVETVRDAVAEGRDLVRPHQPD